MGGLVKEVLRRLCVEFGWSYAVFWKLIGFGDQLNLVWEDGHCERTSVASAASGFEAIDLLIKESGVLRGSQNGGFSQLGGTEDRVRTLVFKLMATQVHLVGDGIVGKAALTGKHEWMLGDMLSNRGSTSKVLAEINNQLLAGIKTTAIIPVLPQGILQLGSTQMVPENFGFIVHVKGLFGQLQFVPGSLLSSDTQKNLCQKLVHESTGMQMTHKQYREARTDLNGSSSVNDDNHNHQHFSPADSRTFTEICPSSTLLYDQMSAIVSETSLAKENMSSKMVPPSTQPIVETHHGQVESEAHLTFSNPDARLLQNILPCKSNSQNHEQPPTGLPYNRLTFLEEQLLSMPSVRAGEFANNRESTLANSNMLQLLSYGRTSLHPLQGSESISSLARSQYLESANGIGKFNSFASGVGSFRSQHADSSSAELPQVLNPIDHLEQGHLNSIDTRFQSGSPREKQKSNDGQYQASEGQFTHYDEHGSSYSPLLDPVQKNKAHQESPCVENGRDPTPTGSGNKSNVKAGNLQALDEKISVSLLQSSSANDLFDALRLDLYKCQFSDGKLDNAKIHAAENAHGLNTDVSNCITEFEEYLGYNALNNELFCSGMFSEAGSDQLLDAVVSQFNPGAKYEMDDIASCKNPLTKISSSSTNGRATTCKKAHAETFSLPPVPIKPEPAPSSSLKSSCSIERSDGCISQSHGSYKSQINQWIEGQKMSSENHSGAHGKKADEGGKQVRKRSRPGENPRPRPKDRQMIQDRVKELREIIPNGPKLSIDALLEKTIKHMLFLQSVTKHADKLKEIGEPKILSKDGGLLLKDNFEGGATWAFEVGSQSMTCPIIVEDLNPPRQMLVEMLCEERGLFLEIADLVRGLGLTILKGAMEARGDKIWARFAVEANRDVTRMEIFLSLVQLLQPSATSNKIPEGLNKPQNMFHSSSSIPATGLSDRLW